MTDLAVSTPGDQPADDRCLITPTCQRGRHTPAAHPCGGPFHQPGDPCQFCGTPLTADASDVVQPCPDCWQPITIADMKAIAAGAGLDATVTTRSSGRMDS